MIGFWLHVLEINISHMRVARFDGHTGVMLLFLSLLQMVLSTLEGSFGPFTLLQQLLFL